jgi:hypothetical protein
MMPLPNIHNAASLLWPQSYFSAVSLFDEYGAIGGPFEVGPQLLDVALELLLCQFVFSGKVYGGVFGAPFFAQVSAEFASVSAFGTCFSMDVYIYHTWIACNASGANNKSNNVTDDQS